MLKRPPFPSRRRLLWLVLAAACAGVLAAMWFWTSRPPQPVAGPREGTRPNLLLVTIDTLRADRAVPDLMPNLTAIASRGTAFTNARTVAPLTLPAHASLMTGLLPPRTGVRLNGVHRLAASVPTLAGLLQGAGYRTAAFVGAFVLDRRFGLAGGFETYDDEIPRGDEASGALEAERRGDVVVDRAVTWFRGAAGDSRPVFVWVHLYDPHAPYSPPAEWRVRADGAPYDGEVAFADAQLGRLVDAVRASGLETSTITVVAGDHGESLGDHGEATHGMLLYESALRVPLVVAGPGVSAGSLDVEASLVDVLPTVLRLAGLAVPPGLDGADLFGPGGGAERAEVYAETLYPEAAGCSPLRALTDGRWKLIAGPAVPELYDLDRDPGETDDRLSTHRSIADAMGSRIAALAAREAPDAAAAPPPEVVERLRALGYVATAPARSADGPGAPSPVTIVRDWSRLEAALEDFAAGRRDRAIGTLASLARARPDASAFQATYARVLVDAGRAPDALDVYRKALRRWPQDTALLHGLAVAARDAGRAGEAMNAEQAALAIDPAHAPALNGLGLLHADAGRATEARAAFERAVTLDPYAVSYWFNLGNARMATGDAAAAETAYREALRLDASSADAANGLGVVLVKTQRAADAVRLFEQIVAASPAFYDAWLNLGIARQELGDRTGAAAAYRRVLAAPQNYAAQRTAAAQLLSSLGEAR